MNEKFKDYYKILGIEKDSDATAIKKAYRRLARQYHPDVNQNNKDATDKFREISEAYEVLGDEEKRKIYDKYGEHYKDYEAWKKAGGEATGVPFDVYMNQVVGGNANAGAGQRSGSTHYRTVSPEDMRDMFGDEADFSDFFYSIFGGGRGAGGASSGIPNRPSAGRDVEYPVQVTLEEAFSGTKRVLEMPTGDPAKPTRRLEVSIPAGVSDGSRVRLGGLGNPGRNGGPAGDLYLLVEVLPHQFYERKGNDLYAKINVPLTTMLLGGETTMPTIKGGRLAVKVPAGTPNNNQMRLRGQGMTAKPGSEERGDLYLTLQVILPTSLTPDEKAAFEKFAQMVEEREKSPSGKAVF